MAGALTGSYTVVREEDRLTYPKTEAVECAQAAATVATTIQVGPNVVAVRPQFQVRGHSRLTAEEAVLSRAGRRKIP